MNIKRCIYSLILALTTFLFVVGMPMSAMAEEGVLLAIETDKADYSHGDTVIFTVTATNQTNKKLTNVTYDVELPKGISLIKGQDTAGSFDTLEVGESKCVRIQASVVAAKAKVQDAKVVGDLPLTGDSALPIVMCAAAGLALLYVGIKHRNRSGATFALVMALVVAGALTLHAQDAHAAESTQSATCEFKLNKKKVQAKVSLAWDSESEPAVPENSMTRAEWISLLVNETGVTVDGSDAAPFTDIEGNAAHDAIVSAYANGCLPEMGDVFSPDAVANRDFVFATAVLRTGFKADESKLSAGDAADAENPALLAIALDFEFVKLDGEGNVHPADAFDRTDAQGLIAAINSFMNDEGEDHSDITFQDDVKVIDGFKNVDGVFTFSSETKVNVGDKVVLRPMEDVNEDAACGVVTSSSSIGDTTSVALDRGVNPQEFFKSIDVSAHDLGIVDLSQIELADGVEFDDEPEMASARGRVDLSTLKLKVKKGGAFATALDVKVTPHVDVDFKWDWKKGLQRIQFMPGVKTSVEGGITLKGESAALKNKVIPLTKKPIRIPIEETGSLAVNLHLDLEMKATGSATVKATFDGYAGLDYRKGHSRILDGDLSGETVAILKGSARFGLKPAATLTVFSLEIGEAGIGIGPSLTGKMTIRDTGLRCTDIAVYLFLELSAELMDSWLPEDASLSAEYEVFGEANSPLKAVVHAENDKIVKKCTYGKEEPIDPDKPVNPDKPVTPERPLGPNESVSKDGFVYSTTFGDDGPEVPDGGVVITDYIGDKEAIVVPKMLDGKKVQQVNFGLQYNDAIWTKAKSIAFEKESEVEYIVFGQQYIGGEIGSPATVQTIDCRNAEKCKGVSIYDHGGSVQKINVENMAALTELSYHRGLDDGSGAGYLKQIALKNNDHLERLNVEGRTQGHELAINLNEAPNLKDLTLAWCGLQSLDISGLKHLESASLHHNHLKDFNVPSGAKLKFLLLNSNEIADTSKIEASIGEDCILNVGDQYPSGWSENDMA